jgi:hypothetical protein
MELSGISASGLVNHIQYGEMKDILIRHGLTEIDVSEWYPMQSILNVLREVSEDGGGMLTLVSIGQGAGRESVQHLPPEADNLSLYEFFKLYEKVFPTRHRHGDPGQIMVEQLDEQHLAVHVVDVVYPDDIMYGLFHELARHFVPAGSHLIVQYDDEMQRDGNGQQRTIIHIRWQ